VIIGISTDTLQMQEKFTEKENLTFPLFADPEQKIAKAFGVATPGKTTARRATFIINKAGVVTKIFDPVKNAGGHPEEVLEYAKKNLKK